MSRRATKLQRQLTFRLTDGFCGICGAALEFVRFETDHVTPYRITKRTIVADMQPTCPHCNRLKGGQYAE
jgi:hypothetical protein